MEATLFVLAVPYLVLVRQKSHQMFTYLHRNEFGCRVIDKKCNFGYPFSFKIYYFIFCFFNDDVTRYLKINTFF